MIYTKRWSLDDNLHKADQSCILADNYSQYTKSILLCILYCVLYVYITNHTPATANPVSIQIKRLYKTTCIPDKWKLSNLYQTLIPQTFL